MRELERTFGEKVVDLAHLVSRDEGAGKDSCLIGQES